MDWTALQIQIGETASRVYRSSTGLFARYNRGVIMWRSKMQKTVSLSTAEAEYYSASEMAIEVLYLRNLLANMGFEQAPTPVCTRTTPSVLKRVTT